MNTESIAKNSRNKKEIIMECEWYARFTHRCTAETSFISSFPWWIDRTSRVFLLQYDVRPSFIFIVRILDGVKSLKFFIIPPMKIEKRQFSTTISFYRLLPRYFIFLPTLWYVCLSRWKSHVFLFFEIL